jgi:hypothetical protein
MYYNQVFIDKHAFDLESKKSKEQGRWTEKLGRFLVDLTRNIIHSSKFNIKDIQNEVYYELEMYILEKLLIRYLLRYDADRGNGFALATSMVINLTYDFLRKLKNHDATGRPKYHKRRNVSTQKRDRIIYVYLDNSASIDNIY